MHLDDFWGLTKNISDGTVEVLELQIEKEVIPLVDLQNKAPLYIEIAKIRNRFENEYGFNFPKVHITETGSFDPNEYSILFRGIEAGRSTVR